MLKQAQKYESMLNQCLIERIAEEERFAAIARLQSILWQRSDEIFQETFDRTRIQ